MLSRTASGTSEPSLSSSSSHSSRPGTSRSGASGEGGCGARSEIRGGGAKARPSPSAAVPGGTNRVGGSGAGSSSGGGGSGHAASSTTSGGGAWSSNGAPAASGSSGCSSVSAEWRRDNSRWRGCSGSSPSDLHGVVGASSGCSKQAAQAPSRSASPSSGSLSCLSKRCGWPDLEEEDLPQGDSRSFMVPPTDTSCLATSKRPATVGRKTDRCTSTPRLPSPLCASFKSRTTKGMPDSSGRMMPSSRASCCSNIRAYVSGSGWRSSLHSCPSPACNGNRAKTWHGDSSVLQEASASVAGRRKTSASPGTSALQRNLRRNPLAFPPIGSKRQLSVSSERSAFTSGAVLGDFRPSGVLPAMATSTS
mmetsp:Transcript_81538/g.182298  ORF Transcript_81538/g.182298 Transcript_81538/m.182298 type:complete len:364 (+) Transcript_81538:455-1546(+)